MKKIESINRLFSSTKVVRYYDKDNLRHNDFGPAVIHENGTKLYFSHGVIHRDYGPAIIDSEGNMCHVRKGTFYYGDKRALGHVMVEYGISMGMR